MWWRHLGGDRGAYNGFDEQLGQFVAYTVTAQADKELRWK
jgi:hypothetical protein